VKKIILINLAFLLNVAMLVGTLPAWAADMPLTFNTPEQLQRYEYLTKELRCLVCQNQNLAESHADLAQDLREEVQQMILAGKSNDEIVDYLVARYGDFVLYKPPVKESTWLLWFAPFVLLLAGVSIVYRFARGRSQMPQPELSAEQQTQLANLLGEERK